VAAGAIHAQLPSRRKHPKNLTTMKIISLLAALSIACVSTFAQTARSSSTSPEKGAASLPQDRHEGMSISADPYTNSARAKEKFGKANPVEVGILPVEVFIRNETAQPMRVNLETVQLEVHFSNGTRQDIDWLRPAEVANAIAHPGGAKNPQARRLPIPLPSNDKKADKLAEILAPLTLDADVVPPMGMVHGFLYFNVNHEMSVAANSTLYAPDIVILPTNKPLMFFEVPLGAPPQ
jgi:hypothetical protein